MHGCTTATVGGQSIIGMPVSPSEPTPAADTHARIQGADYDNAHNTTFLDEDVDPGEMDDDDEDEFIGNADADIPDLPEYISLSKEHPPDNTIHDGAAGDEAANAPGPVEETVPPQTDALNNAYVRVVHTNGIHHLAMVTCRCRGFDTLPIDLVASQFLPASFVNIRTLFSTQLLGYFRLCNLELKASAYQFYTLLRRLTNPGAPADVVDLYNEFRRMARFWRWMKKLKWAGYAHNGKDPMNVEPGGLATFCPACPQPNINLPSDWKDDVNRYAQS